MTWPRRLGAVAVAAVAAVALHRLVVIPYRCNVIEGQVSRATERVWSERESYRAREVAQRNVALIEECASRCRTDVNLAMLLGSNLWILGRHDAALQQYREALRYEHRPELYMALGLAQSKAGMPEEALANFVRAGEFAGLHILRDIPDAALRWRAHELVGARIEDSLARSGRLNVKNFVQNGTFAKGTAGWTPHGDVAVEVVPSTRNPGTRALRVVAREQHAGIRQRYAALSEAPRVRASVWVYVIRGRVAMGTNSGGAPLHNVVSATTGRWERLQAVNESCPSRWITIDAADPGGAEFLVDTVEVRTTVAAPPCER